MKDKFSIDYKFEIKETEESDGFFYFNGYGSTKDLDLVNDIFEPTAFNESIKRGLPKMLWQHNRDEPIGVYIEAVPDSKGLRVRGKMPLDDTFVSGRVIPQLKAGSVDALSIGFRVKRSEWDQARGIRTVKEADLHEVSLVTFPANPEARVTGLKALEEWAEGQPISLGIKDVKKELFAPLTHRWDAADAAERMGLEKGAVNISDMIKGAPFYVPRAIFAMRVAIDKGLYSGDEIKETINLLYEGLELPEPFQDGKSRAYCKTELKNLLTGDLLFVVRYKELSKDAADHVVGALLAFEKGVTPEVESAFSELLDGFKKLNAEVK